MKRFFSILSGSDEYVLPVTPASITLQNGIKIETVGIYGIGDIQLAGNRSIGSIQISSFFPAQEYDFLIGAFRNPYDWVKIFKNLISKKKPVRFLVSDTDINARVLISNIEFSEKPGQNDIYYTLTLAESDTTGDDPDAEERPEDDAPTLPTTYIVAYGDTLWGIATHFYGKGILYKKIASANGIQDPNVVAVGRKLKIPEV